jgi:hypothetical protein
MSEAFIVGCRRMLTPVMQLATEIVSTDQLCNIQKRVTSKNIVVCCCVQASINERAKFKAETLSNVGGRVLTTSLKESGTGGLAAVEAHGSTVILAARVTRED